MAVFPSSSAPRWSAPLELIAILCFFCVPLFIGLRGWDLRNDEAIYSYAVDGIVETGDWLTPRLIPHDPPFLEKPPLKFWIVAAAIRAGVLPHDEFGLRFIDAVFGTVAFIYVFLVGRWLAGPGCGFVAVLLLFTLDPFVFDHGLRTNNMEAPLILSYCGGIYHFARWVEEDPARARAHAVATGVYFTLGFMTKFVAVLFLPLVCAVALLWRRDAAARIRSGWRDWVAPLVVALAVITPWFAYQTLHVGRQLWQEMFGIHVYERFTAALDPRHLRPWHHYFSHWWFELTLARSQWISAAGALLLAVSAWQGRPWLARLLFVWSLLPLALLSLVGSKVFHYAYPFLPPLAIGAGAAVVALFRALDQKAGAALVERLQFLLPRWAALRSTTARVMRSVIVTAAVVSVGVSVWTALAGRIRLHVGDVQLLTNASTVRPAVFGVLLFILAGYARGVWRAFALLLVALALPVSTYLVKAERVTTVDHPLRTLRDCVAAMQASRPDTRTGTYLTVAYADLLNHAYFYYLRDLGPWVETVRPEQDRLMRRLFSPGEQSLVILLKTDYDAFVERLDADHPAVRVPRGILFPDDAVVMAPGPFTDCAGEALTAGGRALGWTAAPNTYP